MIALVTDLKILCTNINAIYENTETTFRNMMTVFHDLKGLFLTVEAISKGKAASDDKKPTSRRRFEKLQADMKVLDLLMNHISLGIKSMVKGCQTMYDETTRMSVTIEKASKCDSSICENFKSIIAATRSTAPNLKLSLLNIEPVSESLYKVYLDTKRFNILIEILCNVEYTIAKAMSMIFMGIEIVSECMEPASERIEILSVGMLAAATENTEPMTSFIDIIEPGSAEKNIIVDSVESIFATRKDLSRQMRRLTDFKKASSDINTVYKDIEVKLQDRKVEFSDLEDLFPVMEAVVASHLAQETRSTVKKLTSKCIIHLFEKLKALNSSLNIITSAMKSIQEGRKGLDEGAQVMSSSIENVTKRKNSVCKRLKATIITMRGFVSTVSKMSSLNKENIHEILENVKSDLIILNTDMNILREGEARASAGMSRAFHNIKWVIEHMESASTSLEYLSEGLMSGIQGPEALLSFFINS